MKSPTELTECHRVLFILKSLLCKSVKSVGILMFFISAISCDFRKKSIFSAVQILVRRLPRRHHPSQIFVLNHSAMS